jgi:hypothetical protein
MASSASSQSSICSSLACFSASLSSVASRGCSLGSDSGRKESHVLGAECLALLQGFALDLRLFLSVTGQRGRGRLIQRPQCGEQGLSARYGIFLILPKLFLSKNAATSQQVPRVYGFGQGAPLRRSCRAAPDITVAAMSFGGRCCALNGCTPGGLPQLPSPLIASGGQTQPEGLHCNREFSSPSASIRPPRLGPRPAQLGLVLRCNCALRIHRSSRARCGS